MPSTTGERLDAHPDRPRGVSTSDRVRVIRDSDELADIREAWLRLQGDQITTDPDLFEVSVQADPKIVRPHLLVLERAGTPVAMLVGRLERGELSVKLGYRQIYDPRVSSITIVYGGILGEPDDDSFRLLLASLSDSLAAGEADVTTFRYLALDSPYYQVAASEPGFLRRQHVSHAELHWEQALPSSFEQFLQSHRRTQKNMASATRRLHREFGDRVSVRLFTDPEDIDTYFADVETVARTTYQRRLGVAFGDLAAHRARTRLCMERGWYRGYVLYIDGEPRAFEHGDLYRGRYRGGRPGFDREYARFRIGWYLFMRSIEGLCADPGADVLDYGIGDADFKQWYGTRSWKEANVVIYAPSLRGARINLTRAALLTGTNATKRLIGAGKLDRVIKRRWRARKTPPSGSS